MGEDIVVTGIVLYTSLVNEYDKRLVVLTKERGKITVFANGARRPNSVIRAASQSYVMGKFTVTAGRDVYTLHQAEVSEYFSEIAQDMEKLCYAAYFCEFMSYYTREGDRCKDNLNLLYFTLKALVDEKMSYRLIRYVYEVRLMDTEGQGIHAFSCVKCNEKEKLTYFDAAQGGFLCEGCASKYHISQKISPTLVYTVQYIMSTPVNKLYNFNLSDDAFRELEFVVDRFKKEYVDKAFKSLEILSTLAL
jgi:DNA repair protein RecO (recombination protein O)